jgi:hypothetical protein
VEAEQVEMRSLYLVLAITGTVLPLSQFIPWVADHGLDPALFVDQLMVTSISRFFAFDLIVTAVAAISLMLIESRRSQVPRVWLPIIGTLTVGVSLGLPLFLAMREQALAGAGRAPQPMR